LTSRKHRSRTRLFLVEGTRLVREALEAGGQVVTLIVAPGLLNRRAAQLAERVRSLRSVTALEVTLEVLTSVFPEHGGEGIAAVLRQRWSTLDGLPVTPDSCFVAAKQIRQPWSVGNIVRACDAVAAQGVILVGDSTDPYHPAAVRASLGAVFSQPLVSTTLRDLAGWKARRACRVVGASPAGTENYWEMDYRGPLMVFVGGEREGLSAGEEAICDAMVRIPMAGRCESHHVAVATGLILYEVFRQRQAGTTEAMEGDRDA
jgi:TrmH family RNA methyltransferase